MIQFNNSLREQLKEAIKSKKLSIAEPYKKKLEKKPKSVSKIFTFTKLKKEQP